MKQFENKVVLVTGGNSGIGLAAAKRFYDDGARVFITASTEKTYANAVKEFAGKFDVIQADVSRIEDVKHLMNEIREKAGQLDSVFANAGVSLVKLTQDFTEPDYDRIFDINVKGLYLTIQHALPLLRDQASVVLNASLSSSIGFPGGSVYGASKAAVRSFARYWAAEFGSRGIRFNVVSPGLIETPIYQKLGLGDEGLKSIIEMSKQNPLGRIGTPEEVAEVVFFLASKHASYINGVELFVDGGQAAVGK